MWDCLSIRTSIDHAMISIKLLKHLIFGIILTKTRPISIPVNLSNILLFSYYFVSTSYADMQYKVDGRILTGHC